MEKKIVALVDDEPAILDMHEDLLGSDFDILKFKSPEEFLEYLNGHMEVPFDALISDYRMPRMNGLEMIMKAHEKGYYFPFLLFSGYLSKDLMKQAVNVGAFRLLEKPSNRYEILRALNDVIYENQFQKVRKEIRVTIDRLREFYSTIAVLLTQYLPPEELGKLVIEFNGGPSPQVIDGERLMANLEKHLDELLAQDEELDRIRKDLMKKAS